MDIERERKVLAICDEALELEPDNRKAFIESRCLDDKEMLDAVNTCLAANMSMSFEKRLAGAVNDVVKDLNGLSLEGQTLGRYQFGSLIGMGGMGVVYQGFDFELKRDVALKVLSPDLAEDSDFVRRFRREGETAAGLNHPNIVTIYSVEHINDHHFICMELVKGQTLNKIIIETGLEIERFQMVATQLVSALSEAHRKGIVHRDLKPSNIILDQNDLVKVTDFGLARRIDPRSPADETLTRSGFVMGTVPYMSPEQLKGKRVDKRADVFALGVIFYELLTGSRPFTGDSQSEIMAAILRDQPESAFHLRPGIPSVLNDLITGCLVKEPEERFESALVLMRYLETWKKDSLTRATIVKPLRKRRLKISFSFKPVIRIIGLLILVGGGWFWVNYQSLSRIGKNREVEKPAGFTLDETLSAAEQHAIEGRYEDATFLLERYLERDPERIDVLLIASRYHAANGDKSEALNLMTQAYQLKDQIDQPDLKGQVIGSYYLHTHQWSKARAEFQRRLAIDPEDRSALSSLAQSHMLLENKGKELETFNTLIELDANNSRDFGMYLLALTANNRWDEALRNSESDLERFESLAHIYWGRGLAFLASGDPYEAERFFRKMMEPDKDGKVNSLYKNWSGLLLAETFYMQGRWLAAKALLEEEATKSSRENRNSLAIRANIWLAIISNSLNEPVEAEEYLDTTMFISDIPDNTRFLRRAALIYIELGRIQKAKRLLNRLKKINEKWSSDESRGAVAHVAASIGFAQGESDSGGRDLRLARRNWPDARVLYDLARTYHSDGDCDQARPYLEEIYYARRGAIFRNDFPDVWLNSLHLLHECLKDDNQHDRARILKTEFEKTWPDLAKIRTLD